MDLTVDSAESTGGKQGRSRPGSAAEWLRSITIAFILVVLLRSFALQTFVVTSGSMENALLVGDMLVVNRAAMGSRVPFTNLRIPGYSAPHRGDVLVFTLPPPDGVNMKLLERLIDMRGDSAAGQGHKSLHAELPPISGNMELVKRLIGMPGDTLQMKRGVLYIDGKPHTEPYVRHGHSPDQADPWMFWQKKYLEPGVDHQAYAPTRDNWGPLIIPAGRYFMMGDNRESSLDSRYWGLVARWRIEGRVEVVYFSYKRDSQRPWPWIREIRWSRIGRVKG